MPDDPLAKIRTPEQVDEWVRAERAAGRRIGFTCGSNSNANFGTIESPNHNPDGDVEISPTSHEIMESITDPDTNTGYYDAHFLENGDECAYVYGPTAGNLGALWNQTINGHHYLTQEEFSNLDYNATHRGCRPTQYGF